MPRSNQAKLWSDKSMKAAISAVANGMSKRAAAQQFNVPRSTLHDRLSGRVEHGSRSGPKTFLTASQENQLAAYLIETSKQGYGKSKEIILFMATSIAKRNGKVIKGGSLSKKWWSGFLKRHTSIRPEIIRSGSATTAVNAISAPATTGVISTTPAPTTIATAVANSNQAPATSTDSSNLAPITPVVSTASITLDTCISQFPAPPACPSPAEATIQATDCLLDLLQLERIIGKEQRDKFRKRIKNGYDIKTDTLYNTWKKIFLVAGGSPQNESSCPCNGACCCTCRGIGYCDCIESTSMHLSSQSPPCQQPTPLHQISTPSEPVTLDA